MRIIGVKKRWARSHTMKKRRSKNIRRVSVYYFWFSFFFYYFGKSDHDRTLLDNRTRMSKRMRGKEIDYYYYYYYYTLYFSFVSLHVAQERRCVTNITCRWPICFGAAICTRFSCVCIASYDRECEKGKSSYVFRPYFSASCIRSFCKVSVRERERENLASFARRVTVESWNAMYTSMILFLWKCAWI